MGGKRLQGEVEISGAKNAAIAIIPAAVLVNGLCCIENLPDIADVKLILKILQELGAVIRYISPTAVEIDARNIDTYKAPYEMVSKMRASYYLLGALLGRFKKAEVAMPGGCNFGVRPIDQHLKGFKLLGAEIDLNHGIVTAEAEELVGTQIYLDIVSVGATINVMIASVLAKGTTYIENVSKEPHVVDVANFLNSMGANIKGAGTDVIRVTGVEELKGGTYTVIPDQIEAGTYMIAAAATKGDVTIKNIIPKHLDAVSAKLREMGVDVIEHDDSIRVKAKRTEIMPANVKTLPYPGFPTDLQPQIGTLLSIANGVSVLTESVWDNRFQYINELRRMGANIKVDASSAIIQGVESLEGSPVMATDLRAGAALVIAGLVAKGKTELYNVQYIDRGYNDLDKKLVKLGAQIVRKEVPDEVMIEADIIKKSS